MSDSFDVIFVASDLDDLDDTAEWEGEGEEDEDDGYDDEHVSTHSLPLLTGLNIWF